MFSNSLSVIKPENKKGYTLQFSSVNFGALEDQSQEAEGEKDLFI